MKLGMSIVVNRQLAVKTFVIGVLSCFPLICSLEARAEDQKNLENDLRKVYEHKLLSLKNPSFGPKLEFDSTGKQVSRVVAGPWSTCGLLRVEKIVWGPGHLQIEGKRVILALRSAESVKQLQLPSNLQVMPLVTEDRLRIVVKMSASDVLQVNNALSQVFQGGPLLERVAAYWKPKTADLKAFRINTPNEVVAELEGNRPVYLANPDVVKPPEAIYHADPMYTDAARRDRLEGTTVLQIVVNEKVYPKYWR
ncbi:MAG: hypothetical protein ACRD20_16380 [Terriglobales bacterium]